MVRFIILVSIALFVLLGCSASEYDPYAVKDYIESRYGVEFELLKYTVPRAGFNPTANRYMQARFEFRDSTGLRFSVSQSLENPDDVASNYLKNLLGRSLLPSLELDAELSDSVLHHMSVYYSDIYEDYQLGTLKSNFKDASFSVVNYLAVVEVSSVEDISNYIEGLYAVLNQLRGMDTLWYVMQVAFVHDASEFKDKIDVPELYLVNGFEYQAGVLAYIEFNDVSSPSSIEEFRDKLVLLE